MFEAILGINCILDGKQKVQIICLLVLMLLTAILETAGISLVIPYIAAVVQPEKLVAKPLMAEVMDIFGIVTTKELLIALTVFLILVYFVKNVSLYVVNVLRVRFVNENKTNLANRLMQSLLSKPYLFYLAKDSSHLAALFTNDIVKIYDVIAALLYVVTELFMVFTIFCLLCTVDWQVTLTFLLMLGLLFGLLDKVIKPKIARLGRKTWLYWQSYVKIIAEIFGGFKEIRVQRAESNFYECFTEAGRMNANMDNRKIMFTAIPQAVTELACIGGVLSVMLVKIINDNFTPDFLGVISLFALASIRLVPCSNRIHSNLNIITYNLPCLQSVQAQLGDLRRADAGDTVVTAQKKPYPLQKEIRFSQVSFRYSHGSEPVLDRADMVIGKGKKVGIIGATGSGKTTTMNLLLGLLQPSGGKIWVDDWDGAVLQKDWYLPIGFVPQDIFLLNDSIIANVAFGRAVDEKEIMGVLEKAELAEFVKTLPQGLATVIGERGVRLSGGQRQRLGIARALYGNPEVLLCDEATSALDNDTEQEVIKAVYTLGREHTVIMIAHRLTTIEYCDVVYKIEQGKIVDWTEGFFREHPHRV